MFYAIPVLALMAGIVVGINFNVVMLGNLAILSLVAWVLASVTSGMSLMATIVSIVLTAVALQLGYFVGLIIVSLGLSKEPAEPGSSAAAPSRIRRILTFGRQG